MSAVPNGKSRVAIDPNRPRAPVNKPNQGAIANLCSVRGPQRNVVSQCDLIPIAGGRFGEPPLPENGTVKMMSNAVGSIASLESSAKGR